MDATRMGRQALIGWRATVAEPVADRVSRHSRFSAEQAQAAIGAAFFLLSVYYVVKTVMAVARER